jgi:hypothetical protein
VKQALKAAAKLANVDLQTAATTVRQNPILGEEIHIEEELLNLEEALATNRAAEDSLKDYPTLHNHIVREQRLMLKHCFGQAVRMLQGRRLPRKYSSKDIEYAISKLIQILIGEAIRVGKHIDKEILETVKPFLTMRQRYELGEWNSISPRLYMQLARHKLATLAGSTKNTLAP